ncbi:outer membrane beta-barrel protein [Photobacterium leiognathi]|uniref:outer membrane beta-barrel protein n=1 Tax=Photobacterium leiognathi TaxID=553611 RepID=UPI002981C5E4|nr:outer membrane beta-barrel protein [Photobacterium leiognathi]
MYNINETMLNKCKAIVISPIVVVILSASMSNNAFANIDYYFNVNTNYQLADDHTYDGDDRPQSIGGGFGGGIFITPEINWNLNINKSIDLEAEKNEIKFKSYYIDNTLSYHYAIDELKDVYFGVGGAYWNGKKSSKTYNFSGHGFSPLAKVGVMFQYDENITFDIGYKYIDSIGNKYTGEYDSHILFFGFNYKINSSLGFKDKKENIIFTENHVVKTSSEERKSNVTIFNTAFTKEYIKNILKNIYPNFEYEVIGCGEDSCSNDSSMLSDSRLAYELRRVDIYVQ